MVSWEDVESAEPEFAGRIRALFEAHTNKILATPRADGSPRVSGVEAQFVAGEPTFGSMPGARKAVDLHRDPRFALHGPSPDPPEPKAWAGDTKIAGRAVAGGRIDDEPEPGVRYRADIDEAVITRLNDSADRLVMEI